MVPHVPFLVHICFDKVTESLEHSGSLVGLFLIIIKGTEETWVDCHERRSVGQVTKIMQALIPLYSS